jgi:hypothetical protein
MPRLRLKNACSLATPVAAEVLESRALLSGSAAAVHAAMQHATALHSARQHAAPSPNLSFQGTASLGELIVANTPIYFGAKVSIPSFAPTAGSPFSAKFQVGFKNSSETLSIKGTFKGTISQVLPPVGGITEIHVVPTVGTVTFSEVIPGHQYKYTATTDGSFFIVHCHDTYFTELAAVNDFSASAPFGLANKGVTFDVKPSAQP